MLHTRLVNLASASNPTFLSLSGNLHIRTAWTECSLASRLQPVRSLACWQPRMALSSVAALPRIAPNNPLTQSSSCTLWGCRTGAPITEFWRLGAPCKSQQLLHWQGTCLPLENKQGKHIPASSCASCIWKAPSRKYPLLLLAMQSWLHF